MKHLFAVTDEMGNKYDIFTNDGGIQLIVVESNTIIGAFGIDKDHIKNGNFSLIKEPHDVSLEILEKISKGLKLGTLW